MLDTDIEPDASTVQVLSDYRLLITFANGEKKVYDMSELLYLPVYQKLKNPHIFAAVRVQRGVVCWDDMTDLAPETAYFSSVALNKEGAYDPTRHLFALQKPALRSARCGATLGKVGTHGTL